MTQIWKADKHRIVVHRSPDARPTIAAMCHTTTHAETLVGGLSVLAQVHKAIQKGNAHVSAHEMEAIERALHLAGMLT